MNGYREALGLGFELSGFILASYAGYEWLAEVLGFDQNLTLAALLGLSLILWTLHAYFIFEKNN